MNKLDSYVVEQLRSYSKEIAEVIRAIENGDKDAKHKIATLAEGAQEHVRMAVLDHLYQQIEARNKNKFKDILAHINRQRAILTGQRAPEKLAMKRWIAYILPNMLNKRVFERKAHMQAKDIHLDEMGVKQDNDKHITLGNLHADHLPKDLVQSHHHDLMKSDH